VIYPFERRGVKA